MSLEKQDTVPDLEGIAEFIGAVRERIGTIVVGQDVVVERLLRIAPRRLVYLSCDPATLARDLGHLIRGGYELAHVEAFDLFPQTPHVEVLVALEGDPRAVSGSHE